MARPKSLKTIYKSIHPLVADIAQASLKKNDYYAIALKAALVKNYDFNAYVSSLKSTSHSFYLTATLRGICEDVIFLKSIIGFSQKDRAELIQHAMLSNTFEGMWRQAEFFKRNRKEQPVLVVKDVEAKLQAEEDAVLQIFARYNLAQGGRKPTVRKLAKTCNLLSLYDYMYSATSKWVHFSPQILLRMGWSPEHSPDATFTFSTKNFDRYYAEFNSTYGAYLLILFYDSFKAELNLDSKFGRFVADLRFNIDESWRWPELVTYEEMNRRPPSPILLGALKVLKDEGKL